MGWVDEAVEWLEKGGVIAYPTDTVYGIGADATNPEAVRKVYELKKRPMDKPVSVMFGSREQALEWVEPSSLGERLMEYLPGKLTIISRRKMDLPVPGVKLGFRIPAHEFCLELARKFGKPIITTSANIAGGKPAKSPAELPQEWEGKVLVVPGEAGSEPSTVVDDSGKILRSGAFVWHRAMDFEAGTAEDAARLLLATGRKVFFLQGGLGSGKTAIIKAMGREIGISDMSSPSFSIVNDHGNAVHMDFYRLETEQELETIGFDRYAGYEWMFVEWADRFPARLRELNLKRKTAWVFVEEMPDGRRHIRALLDYV